MVKKQISHHSKRSTVLIIVGLLAAIMSFVIALFCWLALLGGESHLIVWAIAVSSTLTGILAITAVVKNKPEWLLIGLLVNPLG